MANQLQHETSPYLLQHAHNPVDWYPWGEVAFERARVENKPVIVSIGYSTCHWCHVMERESFEDEDIASFMNRFFINIKVDREERPDVDHLYMEACQALTGSGGWPLNVFLTPDGRPFYAGTYFPPESMHNRPSWIQVLKYIHHTFADKREVVEEQANRLLGAIQRADGAFFSNDLQADTETDAKFRPNWPKQLFDSFAERVDKVHGGFDGAPKFPATMSLEYLLDYYMFTRDQVALDYVDFSLKKMIFGGIYDQIGGGFARYATDRAWIVPHFEKMLYDNALLVSLLSRMAQVTSDPLYTEILHQTLGFIQREMTDSSGGFYSALDADSEGEEGKYYVWDVAEIEDLLGTDAALFCKFFQAVPGGNWEGKNILHRKKGYIAFAEEEGLDPEGLKAMLERSVPRLLSAREARVRPGLDDKILLNWNALQCSAYVHAWQATAATEYLEAARKNMQFLLDTFRRSDKPGALWHTWKAGQARYSAFLDDYAFLIRALIDLYEVTFDESLLLQASEFADYVVNEFYDATGGLFFFTDSSQTDLIVRKKDLYDSSIPSGNAVMLMNLQKLAVMLGKSEFATIASAMLGKMKAAVERYPSSFAYWARCMLYEVQGWKEIAVVGDHAFAQAEKLNRLYFPARILMATEQAQSDFPLLAHRYSPGQDLFFLCEHFSCRRPTADWDTFLRMLRS